MGEMTLECVSELDDPAVASVVVVDNAFGDADGDSDGDARAQIASRATIVPLDRPHGFAAANNRGLARGGAPYALLLNSDVLVERGAIERLLRALDDEPRAVAAGGRLVDPHTLVTQQQYRPRPFPTLANFLVIVLGIEELWPGNPVTRRYHGAQSTTSRVQRGRAQPAAAALLVRRDALDAVGGFDERFWFWFEDSDLLLRLSAARQRSSTSPAPSSATSAAEPSGTWSKAEHIRSIHHGIVQYADAHFSRIQRAVLGIAELAVSLPRVALFARLRPDEARRGGRSCEAGRRCCVVSDRRRSRPALETPRPLSPLSKELLGCHHPLESNEGALQCVVLRYEPGAPPLCERHIHKVVDRVIA